MEAVFLKILNMGIAAGWVALGVIGARFLLKKAPKWITVALWGLVALRLMFPVSWQSGFSLVPSAQTVPEDILQTGTPSIQSGIEVINTVVNPILSESLAPSGGDSGNPLELITGVACVIWLTGMAGMLVYGAVSYWKIRRRIREAVPLEKNVWQCDHVDTPFILGVFRPRILLPSAMDEDDQHYVVCHEQAHLRRRDHWWKPLGFLLLSVYWFQPVLWAAYLLLCRDIEMACDEKVIREIGPESKTAYSQALINCSVPRRMIAACPLAFGEIGVRERVKNVLNYKRPAFWVIVAAVMICVAAGVCFLTNPAESGGLAMKSGNVSGINPDGIVDFITGNDGFDWEDIYIDPEQFSLALDGNFNWSGPQTVGYFFSKNEDTYTARLDISPRKQKITVTKPGKCPPREPQALLYHCMLAVKYLPQAQIRQLAPADGYRLHLAADGRPEDYARAIVYFPEGLDKYGEQLLHLRLEPLRKVGGGDTVVAGEAVHLFYSDSGTRERFPQYYHLDATDGLDVYVWQMAPNSYNFGLMPHSETPLSSADLLTLYGTTAAQMRQILASYEIAESDIHIIPWGNPISSYTPDPYPWIISKGENVQEKVEAYIVFIRGLLFPEQPN